MEKIKAYRFAENILALSPYQAMGDNPVAMVDPLGLRQFKAYSNRGPSVPNPYAYLAYRFPSLARYAQGGDFYNGGNFAKESNYAQLIEYKLINFVINGLRESGSGDFHYNSSKGVWHYTYGNPDYEHMSTVYMEGGQKQNAFPGQTIIGGTFYFGYGGSSMDYNLIGKDWANDAKQYVDVFAQEVGAFDAIINTTKQVSPAVIKASGKFSSYLGVIGWALKIIDAQKNGWKGTMLRTRLLVQPQ